MGARSSVAQSTGAPTEDHAYTEFVASEYYDKNGQKPQSEAALVKAVQSPEPSWEVYARLIDIYMTKSQYPKADALMAQAATRFEDSPVLLPRETHRAVPRGEDGSPTPRP